MTDNSRAKNELQEFLQRRGQKLPLYSMEGSEGGSFKSKVTLEWHGMELSCYGLAPRKKEAEKAAAANMLSKIRELERKPRSAGAVQKQEKVKHGVLSARGSGSSGLEHGKTPTSASTQNPRNPAYPQPANPPAYQQPPPQYSAYPPQPQYPPAAQYPPQPAQYPPQPAQYPPPPAQYPPQPAQYPPPPAQYPPPPAQYPQAQYPPQQAPAYGYGAPATAQLPPQMAGMTLQDRPRAGDTPLLSILTQGNTVILESRSRASRSTTNSLRIDKEGKVNAHGVSGTHAQFTVHVRRPGVIALQNVADPERWIAIYQGKTIGMGKGGPYCDLAVGEVEQSQYIVLESIMHPGYHIGIQPSGDVKDPSQTGIGEHAQFRPKLHTAPVVPQAPLGPNSALTRFVQGGKVVLQSRASGKRLRVVNGRVDGLGTGGQETVFHVEVRHPGVVALRCVGAQQYLAIRDKQITTDAAGGRFCDLIIKEIDTNHVALESVESRGQHVGILPDGCAKPPNQTGTGQHGQFFVAVHTHTPQPKPPTPVPTRAGDTPLLSLFSEGNILILQSRASKGSLRIAPRDVVDGQGGKGQYAQFRVHVRGAQLVALQSVGTGQYLAIKNGMTTIGTGGKFCNLIVKEVDAGYVSLESAEHRTQHVGILPDGCVKAPHATGTGQHGQYSVSVQSYAAPQPVSKLPHAQPRPQPHVQPRPQPTRAGDTPLLSLFAEGNVVLLQSRASGSSLRITSGGAVEGQGGSGEYAQFLVHVRRPGVVALQSKGTRHYLAIRDRHTTTGSGGKFCDLIVKEIDASHVALESAESRGQHVGILPDGCVKPPNQTGTGQHGQFRVSVHSYAPAPRTSHGQINLFGMKIQFGVTK